MGSPSAPTCPPLCRFRLSHHRMMKNVTRIPIVVPPNAPPTIMPVLGEALLLSVLGVELDCAKEQLVRVVIPATVVWAVKENQGLTQMENKISTRRRSCTCSVGLG